MKKFFNEFKLFISRGSVIDLAVGVMMGSAFSAIVTSLVNDIFMPVVSLLTNGFDFKNLFIALDGVAYATLEQAQSAGAATLNYGLFITQIIDFLLMALCVFVVIRLINKFRERFEKPQEKKEARKCPFCLETVSDEATRCPHCTSDISDAQ